MQVAASREARDAFYAAAVLGLRALDARDASARRFGPDANTRWEHFRGALGPGDRIDLLLRDAAVTWKVAFSPALIFDFFGLADDEPFGPDWKPLPDEQARRQLAEASAPDLPTVARQLGVQGSKIALPNLTPSTRLILAGGTAILAIAQAFKADPRLVWSHQVAVVANHPAQRQLAGLAAVLVGAPEATKVLRPVEDVRAALAAVDFPHVDTELVSPDAEPEAARFARRAVEGR